MICLWITWQASSCLLPLFLHTVNDQKLKQERLGNEAMSTLQIHFSLTFFLMFSSLSPPIVGEVQDVYGCALFGEYPVATILRDLSDVYAFEEGETPPTVAEQGPSMYALLFIGISVAPCITERRILCRKLKIGCIYPCFDSCIHSKCP